MRIWVAIWCESWHDDYMNFPKENNQNYINRSAADFESLEVFYPNNVATHEADLVWGVDFEWGVDGDLASVWQSKSGLFVTRDSIINYLATADDIPQDLEDDLNWALDIVEEQLVWRGYEF